MMSSLNYHHRYGTGRQSPGSLPPPYSPNAGHQGAASPGGFTLLQDRVPPPGADPKLWAWFLAVDTDRSGYISVHELQRALINGDWTPFDFDTVKLLMNLFDVKHTGDLDFNGFAGLWKYIEEWQHVFRHFDQDHSGTIDSSELQSALIVFGMKLSDNLLSLLVAKFASSPSGSQQSITFDRFMRACVFVKRFTEMFADLDTDKDGYVQLNYEQLLKFFLSLP